MMFPWACRFLTTTNRLHLSRHLHKRSPPSGEKFGQFPRSPIEFKLLFPDTEYPQSQQFTDPESLVQFVRSFNGSLRLIKDNSSPMIISPYQYKDLNPELVYEIFSPMFRPAAKERLHSQVSDKSFEDKSRAALIRFLNQDTLEYTELDRIVKDGDRIVAEWEGIFEVEGDAVYLLECKHCVTVVSTILSHLH
jgi:hypothetical protein